MRQIVITISVLIKFSLKWKFKILNWFDYADYDLKRKNNLVINKEGLINFFRLSLVSYIVINNIYFDIDLVKDWLFQSDYNLFLMDFEINELDCENLKKYEEEQIEIFRNICFENLKKECSKICL